MKNQLHFTSPHHHEAINTIAESLERAKKLVSPRTGIINKVEFEELLPGEPAVYFARSQPANLSPLCGQEALNFGDAASVDSDRAVMKAVGETIERYCSAHYDKATFPLSNYKDLKDKAVLPQDFALFSKRQYSQANFPFTPMTPDTPLHWVKGYSYKENEFIFVPAAFVFVPYYFNPPDEPTVQDPISTGLACAPSLAAGKYKAILEVIERDAFMIAWQNQWPRPEIDLESVKDPLANQLLQAIKNIPVSCQAFVLTLDINVPVIAVLLQNTSDHFPYTVMGLGADLNPSKALSLALEETCLTYLGMNRYARTQPDYKPKPDFQDLDQPTRHALAHAVCPDLRKSIEFLFLSGKKLSIDDLYNNYNEDMEANVGTLTEYILEKNMDVITLDLTTEDVDDVGFKVVRAVAPGMQPLDISHARRHLGGKRLYEVPCEMGWLNKPRHESELNPFPHPFP